MPIEENNNLDDEIRNIRELQMVTVTVINTREPFQYKITAKKVIYLIRKVDTPIFK